MLPESGGKRDGCKRYGARLQRGSAWSAFSHRSMAGCAAALGKSLRPSGHGSCWLEVPQARKKRQQIDHLLALKYRRSDSAVVALLQHFRRMVAENGSELCGGEWKLVFRTQRWPQGATRSEEHTSELQSPMYL